MVDQISQATSRYILGDAEKQQVALGRGTESVHTVQDTLVLLNFEEYVEAYKTLLYVLVSSLSALLRAPNW